MDAEATAADAGTNTDGAGAVEEASQQSGRPLPPDLAEDLHGRMGADVTGVRVHTGPAADRAAKGVGAKAYTLGKDIYFADGQFDPSSQEGQLLIAHEVAHTLQETPTPAASATLDVSEPAEPAEHEADVFAEAFVAGGREAGTHTSGASGKVMRFPDVVPTVLEADKKRLISSADPSLGNVWEPGRGYQKNTTAARLADITSGGKVGGGFANGDFMYVIDDKGEVWVGKRQGRNTPHPTLLGGENPTVKAAGMVNIRAGKIHRIDNGSGHYHPPRSALSESVKSFTKLPKEIFKKDVKFESLVFDEDGNEKGRKAFRSIRALKLKKFDVGQAVQRTRMRLKHDPKLRSRIKGGAKAGLGILVMMVAEYLLGKWLGDLESKQIRADIERLAPSVEKKLISSLEAQADTFDKLYEKDRDAEIHMNVVYDVQYIHVVDPDVGAEDSYFSTELISAEFATKAIESGMKYDSTEHHGCPSVASTRHERLSASEPVKLKDLLEG